MTGVLPIIQEKLSTSSIPIPSSYAPSPLRFHNGTDGVRRTRSKMNSNGSWLEVNQTITSGSATADGGNTSKDHVDHNDNDHQNSLPIPTKFTIPIHHPNNYNSSSPITAMTTDIHNQYSALVTVHYYHLIQPTDTHHLNSNMIKVNITTMAEIHLHLSCIGQPYTSGRQPPPPSSSTLNTTMSRMVQEEYCEIPLFTNTITIPKKNTNNNWQRDKSWNIMKTNGVGIHWPNDITTISIEFASDGKHIACLIPQPFLQHDELQLELNENENENDNENDNRRRHGISKLVMFALRKTTTTTSLHQSQQQQHQQRRQSLTGTTTTDATEGGGMKPSSSSLHNRSLPVPSYIEQNEDTNTSNLNNTTSTSAASSSSSSSSSMNNHQNRKHVLQPPPIILSAQIVSLDNTTMTTNETPNRNNNDNTNTNKEKNDQDEEDNAYLLTQITSICNVKIRKNACLLMGGCRNGSFVVIGYKRAKLMGSMCFQNDNIDDVVGGIHGNGDLQYGIRHIVHYQPPHDVGRGGSSSSNEENLDVGGRLVAIRNDGRILLYSTTFLLSKSTSKLSKSSKISFVVQNDDDDDITPVPSFTSQQSSKSPTKANDDCNDVTNNGIINGMSKASLHDHEAENNNEDEQGQNGNEHKMNGSSKAKPLPSVSLLHQRQQQSSSSQMNARGFTMQIKLLVGQHGGKGDDDDDDEGILFWPSTLPSFARAIFLDFSMIAFLVDPIQNMLQQQQEQRHEQGNTNLCSSIHKRDESTIAQVWHLNKLTSDSAPFLLAELKMSADQLSELQHGQFSLNVPSTTTSTTSTMSTSSGTNMEQQECLDIKTSRGTDDLMIHLDIETNCLAISSEILLTSRESTSQPIGISTRPFVTIWNWKRGINGFTLSSDNDLQVTMGEDTQNNHYGMRKLIPCLSQIYICRNDVDELCFIHYLQNYEKRRNRPKMKKHIYKCGILSPSEVSSNLMLSPCTVEQPNPVLVTRGAISFPDVIAPTYCRDFTVEWRETALPSSYSSLYGAARITAIGRKSARSLALAASSGLVVFDLSRNKEENKRKVLTNRSGNLVPTPCIEGNQCNKDNTSTAGSVRSNTAKWRRFREMDEKSFTVHAMTWWERWCGKSETSEDLLLAVIEYNSDVQDVSRNRFQNRNTHQYYLVCWSRRNLGMGNLQLIQDSNLDKGHDKLNKGFPLPKDFIPSSISLLTEPEEGANSISNLATLLLASQTPQGFKYVTFQLQKIGVDEVRWGKQSNDRRDCRVLTKLCSSGNVDNDTIPSLGDPCGVFLAGSSFQFDLQRESEDKSNSFTATLGVPCIFGYSLDAITIDSAGPVSCIRLHESVSTSIQSFWLADTVTSNQTDYVCQYIWVLLMSDGNQLTWSLPFFRNTDELLGQRLKVDGGLVGRILNNSEFLHDSISIEHKIILGVMPSMHCRFVLSLGQGGHDMTKMAQQQSLAQSVKVNGVSNCSIGSPAYVSSIFMDLAGSDEKSTHTRKMLERHKYMDTSTVAIQSIVTCAAIIISSSMEKSSMEEMFGSEFNDNILNVARLVLERMASSAKDIMSDVHFASIFLSAGRQLESHQCSYLFPLPICSQSGLDSSRNEIKLEDLYSCAVLTGSLVTAASSLPLLALKQFTYEQSIQLFHHSISAILNFCSPEGRFDISCLYEECLFLQQLYFYGLKLEESIRIFEQNDDLTVSGIMDDDDEDGSDSDYSLSESESYDTDSSVSYDTDPEVYDSLAAPKSPSRVLSLASALFSPTKFFGNKTAQHQSEMKISEAATSFICSGYGDGIQDEKWTNGSTESIKSEESPFSEEIQRTGQDGSTMIFKTHESKIVWTVGAAILSSLFQDYSDETICHDLNKVAVLCLLLERQMEHIDIEHCKALMNRLSGESIQKAVNFVYTMKEGTMGTQTEAGMVKTDQTENFISNLLIASTAQWDRATAYNIYRVLLSLMTCEGGTQSELTPLLALVTLCAGHVCGEIQELFETNDSVVVISPLQMHYQAIEKMV